MSLCIKNSCLCVCSVNKQCPTLRLQYITLTSPPPPPGIYSDLRPLSRWCYPTISSSAAPFFFCLQPFPASGSFPVSWLFASRGQSIRASASVFPMNNQGWFPLELTGLIFMPSKGLWIVLFSTTIRKHRFFGTQPSSWSNSHISMITGKTMCVPRSFSHVRLFRIQWTTAHHSPPGSSGHGILQARILQWVAMPSSRGSSWPRDRTQVSRVSCTGRRVLYH